MPDEPLSRPYAGDDLPRVVELLVAHLAAGHRFEITVADLRQVLPRPSTCSEQNGRVWLNADGEIVGFGLVWPPSNTVLILIHPDLEHGDAAGPVAERVVRWVIDHGREIARTSGVETQVRFRTHDDDWALINLIERHGFRAEDWYTPKYARRLDDVISEPRLPPGFSIRHVAGEQDVEAYVALHRDAFGTPNMYVEERRALMRDPDYVSDLDLVAVAPDGVLAAFVVGGIDREESRFRGQLIGYTDPLGTRPAYRRRGLAGALLYEAFRRLQQHGVAVATVGTGSWNTATISLVESVGFELMTRVLPYAQTFR
jgi:ribosomal protein S18 acetylase RimI-like enzyme